MAGQTLDYKARLEEFIKPIPEKGSVSAGSPAYTRKKINDTLKAAGVVPPKLPAMPKGMAKDERTRLATEHDKALVALQKQHFPATNNDDFKTLTGLTHTGLLANWIGGGQQTSCNSFAGNCGVQMGAKIFLGTFNLEAHLAKNGLSRLWIPATGGRRPAYGDIFEHSDRLHQGVSLGFRGDKWLTVEGGAGGPTHDGVDKVARKEKDFDPSILKGWVSMARYLGAQVPDWLQGWWVIYCGDTLYNYHFSEDFEVSQVLYNPGKAGADPVKPIDTGTFTVSFDDVTVNWKREGGTERFTYDRMESFPALMEKISGVAARGEKLKGIK